jgi:nitroimidazol reductase NimA-like FMN-containing flavoprotein (pyridoxamine 5'-phosphate oxidase superfamily)
MTRLDPRNWMEILPAVECWELLAVSPVGRIAVVTTDGPEIYPVNIAVDGESVVFRTDPGSKLAAIAAEPRVAIEVDGIDVTAREGWSVVVAGRVVELGGDELIEAQHLGLEPWTVGEKARWFRLNPTRISGRGIGLRASKGYA